MRDGLQELIEIMRKRWCKGESGGAAADLLLDLFSVLVHLGQLKLAPVLLRALEHGFRKLIVLGFATTTKLP